MIGDSTKKTTDTYRCFILSFDSCCVQRDMYKSSLHKFNLTLNKLINEYKNIAADVPDTAMQAHANRLISKYSNCLYDSISNFDNHFRESVIMVRDEFDNLKTILEFKFK